MSAELIERLRAAGCVFAEDEAAILLAAATDPGELEGLVLRRISGEPLEYVVGWAEFCGLNLPVRRGVFVPRRRTEFLVEKAVEFAARSATAHPVIVDLCCGSGALGIATVASLESFALHAADVSPEAVEVARENVASLGSVHLGDLFDALPADLHGRVDVLLANVPYVPSGEIEHLPPEARAYEPRITLDGGADGLDVLRRVAAGAPDWLTRGGHVLMEVSTAQAPAALAVLESTGLKAGLATDDERGATVVIGRRSA